MNHYPVTIVENFYKDPFAVRDFALKQKYKTCDQIKKILITFFQDQDQKIFLSLILN